MARRKQKLVVQAPDSVGAANVWIRNLATAQREVDLIQNALNEQIDALKAKAVSDAAPYIADTERYFEGLFVFAERNRSELTDDGKRRSVKLPSGQFGWRTNPPTVVIVKVDDVIERIKSLDLKQFLRTKEEIDKEAMLRDPEKAKSISGVKIKQEEQFFVKPDEEGVDESFSDANKLRKKIEVEL